MGKSAIVGAFVTGLLFAFLVVYLKTGSLQDDPLTHWFNELSYYVKNGFVVIVSAAVFLVRPSRHLVLGALLASVAMYLASRSSGQRRATWCGPGGSSCSASVPWRCRRWCAMDGAFRSAS